MGGRSLRASATTIDYDQDLGVEFQRHIFAKSLPALESKIRREINRRAKGGK
jgi:hypothetical protein